MGIARLYAPSVLQWWWKRGRKALRPLMLNSGRRREKRGGGRLSEECAFWIRSSNHRWVLFVPVSGLFQCLCWRVLLSFSKISSVPFRDNLAYQSLQSPTWSITRSFQSHELKSSGWHTTIGSAPDLPVWRSSHPSFTPYGTCLIPYATAVGSYIPHSFGLWFVALPHSWDKHIFAVLLSTMTIELVAKPPPYTPPPVTKETRRFRSPPCHFLRWTHCGKIVEYADLAIIDLSQSTTAEGRKQLASQVTQAMRTHGFFYVINHGYTPEQVTEIGSIAGLPSDSTWNGNVPDKSYLQHC